LPSFDLSLAIVRPLFVANGDGMGCHEFSVGDRSCDPTQRVWGRKKATMMLLSIAGTSFAGVLVCSALLYLLF